MKTGNYLFPWTVGAAAGLTVVIRSQERNVLVTLALLVENRIAFVHIDPMKFYWATTFAGHDYLRRDQLSWKDSPRMSRVARVPAGRTYSICHVELTRSRSVYIMSLNVAASYGARLLTDMAIKSIRVRPPFDKWWIIYQASNTIRTLRIKSYDETHDRGMINGNLRTINSSLLCLNVK